MGPQEDYIETVFTCEGDFHDPHLQDRLEDFKKSLKDLLLTDKSKLILKKVEPWNSVRVTFNIPREAAVRLKQLAQQGNTRLKNLGVLAVQIQDQHISLTIAGRNNEHAQLVFRTAETTMATTPTVSIFDTNSSSLDEIGPPGPGPSYADTASRSIAEYLRQGLDSILNPSGDKPFQHGNSGNGHKGKPNNIIQSSLDRGLGKHKTFQQPSLQTSHHGNPPRSSPSVNATSPRRSPAGPAGLEFPQLPGLPPGLPPGIPPGPKHPLDNLPPPPPYPQGSSFVNNLQKLRFATDTNPLLVNLLHQHDPNLSNLLQAGLLPPGLESDSLQQPLKKKRKPRKPKEKKKVIDGTIPSSATTVGIPNPMVSVHIPTCLPYSVTMAQASLTTTSFVNKEVVSSVKEHNIQHFPQSVHNMKFQNHPEQILPLSSPTGSKRTDDSDTAGKIINPVTGLLEPMDNLSDTSPAKSDNGKNSPRSLGQKISHLGEVIPTSTMKVESSLSNQGKQPSLHPSIQRSLSEHSRAVNPSALVLANKTHHSSQSNISSDLLQHKQYHAEIFNKETMAKSQVKNDLIPSFDKLEPKVQDRLVANLISVENKCDNVSAPHVSVKAEPGKIVGLPQESDIKSIPPQLLNKPLLQVKHTDSASSKPSGSPDSNGDSECSSQGINLDTQNGAELGSQSGQPLDPRSYNNDSGVGSSSERSDDTPSEPGDSDFKSANTNSFECAKTPALDPLKQTPPTSKIVTVGFAMNEIHKNHKVVSQYMGSDRTVNSKLNMKYKSEKSDLCSPSQLHGLPWTTSDDTIRGSNSVEQYVKQVVQETINRKSPKLSSLNVNALLPNVDGISMQGLSEQSMQKKKSSPRNSPRGSPRNPSSPRNTNSPRGSGSPRAADNIGNSRQAFLTAQEYAAHLPLRESHNKSPYNDNGKSSHGDQRKSPFNFLLTPQTPGSGIKSTPSGSHILTGDRRDHHSVGVDSLRLSPQCNIDNVALLKSLEAAQGSLSLQGKEASILHKLEEFRPYFQKLQQQAAQAAAAPIRNGTEVLNHLTRSPVPHGPINKLGPPPNMEDLHGPFDIAIPNDLHSSVSNSMSGDRESTVVNCVNSKGSKEDQKGASTPAAGSRKSPGAATSNTVSTYPNDSSLLPPPKLLTESVQKLFPNLLDNTLPHNVMNRRSPNSSASVTRVSAPTSMSVSIANSRGQLPQVSPRSSGSKTPISELDLDSITPSISGFGFGPSDFQIDTSLPSHVGLPDSVTMPKLMMMMDSLQPSTVSTSAVKVVPAVLGSITSHRASAGDSVSRSSSVPHNPVSSNGNCSISSSDCLTNVTSANSDTNMSLCNSDPKMAGVMVSHRNSPTLGPPLLHPQVVKYPKSIEEPKSPYQQMGLSEMLQETANLQSISAGRTDSPSTNISSNQTHSQSTVLKSNQESRVNKLLDQNKKVATSAPVVEKIHVTVDSKLSENHKASDTGLSDGISNGDSQDIHGSVENAGIPELKCQISNVSTGSSIPKDTVTSNIVSQRSDPADNKCPDISSSVEPGQFTNKDPSPPVLTAVVSSNCESTSLPTSDPISSYKSPVNTLPVHSSSATTLTEADCVTDTSISDLSSPHTNYPAVVTTEQSLTSPDTASATGDTLDHSVLNMRLLRKRRGSSESIEEKSEGSDVAPRQLRSRKRTNTGESDNASEDSKRLKLDVNSESSVSGRTESAKDTKIVAHSVKTTVHTSVNTNSEPKLSDETNTQDSLGVKGGLRTRTTVKSVPADDKGKPPSGRESRKDGKVISNKSIPEKKTEQSKVDEVKRSQQSRRNRQSPSAPADKLVNTIAPRDKSPLRTSRSRGHNSPVVVENNEETQENKRTTRSAKSKAEPVAQTSAKAMTANKRRRTSQDHR